jgi:hypothetical protein
MHRIRQARQRSTQGDARARDRGGASPARLSASHLEPVSFPDALRHAIAAANSFEAHGMACLEGVRATIDSRATRSWRSKRSRLEARIPHGGAVIDRMSLSASLHPEQCHLDAACRLCARCTSGETLRIERAGVNNSDAAGGHGAATRARLEGDLPVISPRPHGQRERCVAALESRRARRTLEP